MAKFGREKKHSKLEILRLVCLMIDDTHEHSCELSELKFKRVKLKRKNPGN